MEKNSIKNVHLDLNAKRVFVPASDLVQSQVTGASVILDASFGTGSAQYLEVGTSTHGAIRLAATTADINHLWIPDDFDNRFPLHLRYLWTSDYASANGTATFTTLYKAFKTGDAIAIGDTALTIAHGASTKVAATARALYWSKFGTIAPLATGANAYATFNDQTIAIAFNTVCSAVSGITIATDFVHLLGVQLVYTPRLTFGANTRKGRMLVDGLQAGVELDAVNDV